jgi:hypothetical protein
MDLIPQVHEVYSFGNGIQILLSLANLLSLSHVLAKKINEKNPLVDCNQSFVVTSNEYSRFYHKKLWIKEVG